MKILFIDKNQQLVAKVQKAIKHLPFDGVEAECKDIQLAMHNRVVCSASNPDFTFGGGIDVVIEPYFRKEIAKLKWILFRQNP